MKAILPALLALATLCASFAQENAPDLDDPKVRERIIAKAIDIREKPVDYTGWVKEMFGNGRVKRLTQFKDDKPDGLETWWHDNRQKSSEWNYKDGERDGLETRWYENGQKKLEGNYKDNKGIKGSSKFWNNKGEPVDSYKEVYK